MDQNQLLSSAVELGLSLLEKNGLLLPFCKAVNETGETFVYTSASSDGSFSEEKAYQSIRLNVKRDIESRRLKGVAFCSDIRVRLPDSTEEVPAVKAEVHYQGLNPRIWYFLYKMDGSQAKVLKYYTNDANENLFAKV
jgi:hypothetical protein